MANDLNDIVKEKHVGHFVTDLIRCYDNRSNLLVLVFDHKETLEICLGKEHTFAEGQAITVDNADSKLRISYGLLELPRAKTPYNIQVDPDTGKHFVTNATPGFYLMDRERRPFDKLNVTQIRELLALNSCVEVGNIFMEIYDTPTTFVDTLSPKAPRGL